MRNHILISLLRAITIFSKICVCRFLPTKLNKRMKEIAKEVLTLLKEIIDKRERERKAGNAANDDLLGILIESNSRELQESGNEKNAAMSITDVIEECKLFYFAGQETLSFACLDNGYAEQVSKLASACKRRGFVSLWQEQTRL